MRTFILGTVLGLSIAGNAAFALGITLDGVQAAASNRILIATVLLSGKASNVNEALAMADKLLQGARK